MNNKGITYFRLNSPYEGDITKNCALDGYEVDNNFFTLEGRDIKCVYVEDNEIKIEYTGKCDKDTVVKQADHEILLPKTTVCQQYIIVIFNI